MSKDRLCYLIERERDGTLSSVEREELGRLSLADPQARRELAAWSRFDRALGEACAQSTRLDQVRLANRLVSRLRQGPAAAVPLERARLRLPRRALLLAAAAAVGGVFLATRPPEAPRPATQLAKAHPARKRPPVEISADELLGAKSGVGDGAGDEDLALIRF